MEVLEEKCVAFEVGSSKIVNDAPDGDVGCDSKPWKHNKDDSMGDGHANKDKDEYSATIGHADVDLGDNGLNVEVRYDCDPNLDSVTNLIVEGLETK